VPSVFGASSRWMGKEGKEKKWGGACASGLFRGKEGGGKKMVSL